MTRTEKGNVVNQEPCTPLKLQRGKNYIVDTGCTASYTFWPGRICVEDTCVDSEALDPYLALQIAMIKADDKDFEIEGIVGESLLHKFQRVNINYNSRTVEFER